MKFIAIFLLLITFSNFSFAEENIDDFKTTGQKLREKNISEKEICNMSCESKFHNCYNRNLKKVIGCLKEIIICKKECSKTSGKK